VYKPPPPKKKEKKSKLAKILTGKDPIQEQPMFLGTGG
jgi:hypothetical protein